MDPGRFSVFKKASSGIMASSSCSKTLMATENYFVAMVITLNLLTRLLHRNNEDPRYIPEAQLQTHVCSTLLWAFRNVQRYVSISPKKVWQHTKKKVSTRALSRQPLPSSRSSVNLIYERASSMPRSKPIVSQTSPRWCTSAVCPVP